MDDGRLKAILQGEIDNAIGFLETETVEQRKNALTAYMRDPYGNEVEGRSQIVTGEVAEAVDGMLLLCVCSHLPIRLVYLSL
jgi:hypothetical protein